MKLIISLISDGKSQHNKPLCNIDFQFPCDIYKLYKRPAGIYHVRLNNCRCFCCLAQLFIYVYVKSTL